MTQWHLGRAETLSRRFVACDFVARVCYGAPGGKRKLLKASRFAPGGRRDQKTIDCYLLGELWEIFTTTTLGD